MNEGESKKTNDQPDTGMSEEQKDKGQSEPMLDSILHEMTYTFIMRCISPITDYDETIVVVNRFNSVFHPLYRLLIDRLQPFNF